MINAHVYDKQYQATRLLDKFEQWQPLPKGIDMKDSEKAMIVFLTESDGELATYSERCGIYVSSYGRGFVPFLLPFRLPF